MALLKSQRNEFTTMIVAAGMRELDFEWEPGRDRLIYVGAGADRGAYFFEYTDAMTICCRPGRSALEETTTVPLFWVHAAGFARSWLVSLGRELQAPDLWADIVRLREAVQADAASFGETSDLPFSEAERAAIASALDQVRNAIQAQSELTAQQMAAMHASIERLEQSSRSIGKKDLLMVAIGNATAPVFSGVLTYPHAQWLVYQIVAALSSLNLLAAQARAVLNQ